MQSGLSLSARQQSFLKAAAILFGLIYLANCFTPLRLHVDTLRYFAIRDCIEFGCPPDSVAAQDYLPYGYTALLLGLSKVGLLKSFVIVLINCLYLFAALLFVRKLFGNSIKFLPFLLLVLLNWTSIKFVTHALSEMQYVFFSMASLYYFHKYTVSRRIVPLLISFVLGGLAFLTRSVGVALMAALLVGVAWHYRAEIMRIIRGNKIIVAVAVVLVAVIIIFSEQFGLDHYTGVFKKQFAEGRSFSDLMQWHFLEWSEIVLNVSSAKVLPYVPGGMGLPLLVISGAVFVAILLILLFRRADIPFIVKIYLVIYLLLMFSWPFYDPRFWVPVLPLLVAVVMKQDYSFKKFPAAKWAVYALLAFYIVLGIVSAGYMTYTSFNKEVFSRTQASGSYRNEYETYFFGKPQSDTAKTVDPVIVGVMERFNK